MPRRHKPRRNPRLRPAPAGYLLIARGPDGRTRAERFPDAAAYRARLVTLRHTTVGGLSIEEIAGILDSHDS